jgi:hypothetical protein
LYVPDISQNITKKEEVKEAEIPKTKDLENLNSLFSQ